MYTAKIAFILAAQSLSFATPDSDAVKTDLLADGVVIATTNTDTFENLDIDLDKQYVINVSGTAAGVVVGTPATLTFTPRDFYTPTSTEPSDPLPTMRDVMLPAGITVAFTDQ